MDRQTDRQTDRLIDYKRREIKAYKPSLGRNLSFCLSVPNVLIGCMTSDDWTLIADR